MARIQILWKPRERPLKPVAAAARGTCARALAVRLLGWPAERLAKLKGVAGPGLIIVLGDQSALPWVEGICYLGRDEEAGSLLLPTNLEPSAPAALLERAIKSNMTGQGHVGVSPVAVLAEPPAIASVGLSRAIERDSLVTWLKAEKR